MAETNGQQGLKAGVAAATDRRRTRRRLLAGAAGVLGVAAAEVVGKAAPAQADTGQPVLQGVDNGYPTHRTAIFTPNNNEAARLADPGNSGVGSVGVYGTGQDYGVYADAGSGLGIGVNAIGSGTGHGVSGTGGSPSATGSVGGHGVRGQGGSPAGIGVAGVGDASGGPGVVGAGGTGGDGVDGIGGDGGAGVNGTGGFSGGTGVIGNAGGGNSDGVDGFGSGTGAGVSGTGGGSGGPGVIGISGARSGVGVLAENTYGGTALQVSGLAAFNRSGLLTVAAGKSSATQTGVTLTAASLVLATLQQHTTGIYVVAAVPNITGSSFTVYLSKAPTASAKVAWFVVN